MGKLKLALRELLRASKMRAALGIRFVLFPNYDVVVVAGDLLRATLANKSSEPHYWLLTFALLKAERSVPEKGSRKSLSTAFL